ncbi:MAG: hypothetical protein HQL48_09275, partial [Gammaproteobacteria bacterium]|nr:hypothetical protein [Gammaproteobacteria bacterium]
VREAMKTLPLESEAVTIRLNPEDAALIGGHLARSGEEMTVRVVEDPLISRGGAEIATRHSRIDATLESQLESIIANLMGDERKSLRDGGEAADSKEIPATTEPLETEVTEVTVAETGAEEGEDVGSGESS